MDTVDEENGKDVVKDKLTWAEAPRDTAFPIARPGYGVIGATAFLTAILAVLGLKLPALLALTACGFCVWFFRDPDRMTPGGQEVVVAPADGKVIFAGREDNSPFVDGPCRRVSIFMSIFNVHVNRVPFDGVVTGIDYHPGKFFSANLDKAAEQNEKNAVYIETPEGRQLCVVQIAGLIARRIICKLQPGDQVRRGRRFGMICFGSRLDLYLPEDAELAVTAGQKVKAGTTIVGNLS